MEGVMRKAFDVLGQSDRREGLDGAENLRVQLASLLAAQTLVRHVMSQGVLERVLCLGHGARFMDELRALKVPETFLNDVVRAADDRNLQLCLAAEAPMEEIDAALLTSELPIEAYLDRGFQNWLKQPQP